MKRLKSGSLLAIVLLLFASAVTLTSIAPDVRDSAPERASIEAYTPRAPISIDGDTGFNNSTGVTWGSGTPLDPYVIEGWEIDAGGSSNGIYIGNTTKDFSIRNCSLYNATTLHHAGIKLHNVTHGELVGDNCSGNWGEGVLVTNCSDVKIADCLVSSNHFNGTFITGSTEISVTNSSVKNNSFNGIFFEFCSNVTIEGGAVQSSGRTGIYLSSCLNSNAANISSLFNTWYGMYLKSCVNQNATNVNSSSNGFAGIFLSNCLNTGISGSRIFSNVRTGINVEHSDFDVMNSTVSLNQIRGIDALSSENATISGNTVASNNYEGLYIKNCTHGDIVKNEVASNVRSGIYITASSSNVISDNNCSNNDRNGISLESSYDNYIGNNTCSSNNLEGISLLSSDSNVLSNNTCSSNNDYGALIDASDGNEIMDCTCTVNAMGGLRLQNAYSNNVHSNTFANNVYGVYLLGGGSNLLQLNLVNDNINRGIFINSGSNNMIWNNSFAYNNGAGSLYNPSHAQAYDGGTNDKWNTIGSPHGFGNFWMDWTVPDNAAPWGIVDIPYDITSTKDDYPLVTPAPSYWDYFLPVTNYSISGTVGENGWYRSVATMNLSATDIGLGVDATYYRFGTSGGWTAYSFQLIISNEGNTTFEFFTKDKARNEEAIQTYIFKIDTGMPTCIIDNLPSIINQQEVSLSWRGSDSTSGIEHYEMSMDGGPFTPIGNATKLEISLDDGAHTLRLRAVDFAGNIGSSDNVTFTVDTNLFSFSGPAGPLPDIALITAAAAAVVALRLLLMRRKKEGSEKEQTPKK